eukprot:2425692-Rhodomonas_salina.1
MESDGGNLLKPQTTPANPACIIVIMVWNFMSNRPDPEASERQAVIRTEFLLVGDSEALPVLV